MKPAEATTGQGAGDRRGGDRDPRHWHAIYDLADVRVALGRGKADDGLPMFEEELFAEDVSASQSRLRRLLGAGEEGRWRRLAHPTAEAALGVEALGARSPHFREMTGLVTRRVWAAMATDTPVRLPPILLLGPPGVGKSWYMAHLAGILGVPFASYPMNLSTLADGLSGSHPIWRTSAPGLVARTLLQGEVANPLVLVDEVDKPAPAQRDGDAYRPLYSLLEPEGARAFVDEHFQMPLDASAIMWVMSANDLAPLPAPILDRVVVVEVPDMSLEDRMAVVASVYAATNARFFGFFDLDPAPDVLARLATGNARRIRLAVEDAMVRAAADGRHTLRVRLVLAGAPSRPNDRAVN